MEELRIWLWYPRSDSILLCHTLKKSCQIKVQWYRSRKSMALTPQEYFLQTCQLHWVICTLFLSRWNKIIGNCIHILWFYYCMTNCYIWLLLMNLCPDSCWRHNLPWPASPNEWDRGDDLKHDLQKVQGHTILSRIQGWILTNIKRLEITYLRSKFLTIMALSLRQNLWSYLGLHV